MLTTQQNRVRLSLWAIVPAYLLLHGFVATCTPDWLTPLSTFGIVLAELAAIAAAARTALKTPNPVRTWWLLLACAIVFHSIAMSLDMWSEITNKPVFNFVPGFQIFFSMLYGVPLLVAVSLQIDKRIWTITRTVNALLSFAIGAVLYLQIFTLLSVNGSQNPQDAILISRMFDGIDLFLAAGATIRWLGSTELQEYGFFRILSIFLWINALFPAIHNRILLRHDYIWLDLFISAPYAVLFVLILTAENQPARPPSPKLARAVRSGSPIFLTMALVAVGIMASQRHFYVGLAAVLVAIAGYGALNIFTQSRVLETEESLLAAKQHLERLIGFDALTGVANRHAFDESLEREVVASRRTRLPVSLLMIDVDHFKQINDFHGHQVGDEYLIRIAGALKTALPRATDVVARYGGEEFSAILPATDMAGAMKAAMKVHQCIADLALVHPSTPSGNVTISIGFSLFDGLLQHSPATLLRAADKALYIAKRHGRNCSEFLSIDDVAS